MRTGLWTLLLLTVVVAGCGKNDNFRNTGAYGGYGPVAPAPYMAPPATPYYGGGYTPQWQIPPQQPPQFQPFAPMYHYMQQTPQMAGYWQYLWYQWFLYSQQRQVPLYNFQVFWGQFCPQMWGGMSGYQQMYRWFDISVYQPRGYGGYCSICF